jgi:hypothetical protein
LGRSQGFQIDIAQATHQTGTAPVQEVFFHFSPAGQAARASTRRSAQNNPTIFHNHTDAFLQNTPQNIGSEKSPAKSVLASMPER